MHWTWMPTSTRRSVFSTALVVAMGLGGCRGSRDISVDGSAHKGPLVQGSSVLVGLLDTDGAPTGEAVFTETTSYAGDFAIDFAIADFAELEAVAAGNAACALSTDGRVSCWGEETGGILTTPAESFEEVALAGDSNSGYSACGARADGTLACWGR